MADLPFRPKSDSSRDEEEDEEEEIDETGYKTVRDAVLFAIEVSQSMLKKPNLPDTSKADRSSPLEAALKCAYHLMQQRIISAPKDLMGILLYGTEASKFYDEDENSRGGWSFPHCYLLIDLDIPEAEDIKKLKVLMEDPYDEEEAQGLFQVAAEPVSMHSVLFCANQVFQQKASNFTSRRLFVVTDNDNPHGNNKSGQSQATVRAKDLYDLGVTIELFPISSAKHTFDTKLFWDDIVYKTNPSDPDAIMYNLSSHRDVDVKQLKTGTTDGISLLQSLLSNISSRATPKRALFSAANLELGPDLRIGVKGFLLYKHQLPVRSTWIYLQDEKPLIVQNHTTRTAEDDQSYRPVEKIEIKKAYKFGGEQVSFSLEEISEIRNFGTPIIRVIGFKPIAALPMWANIKTSTFIYPFEDDFVGSTRVYSAFYQNLLKKKLMALSWFIARKNAPPVLAAIIPTLPADPDQNSGDQAGVSATGCPQGLHLIPLPFADDLRQNPPSLHPTPLRAPDELVDKMRPIIEQLNLPKGTFDPDRYPNPSLQWHYRILQAIALDEDLPEKPDDKTRPKYKQIGKRAGSMAIEWGDELQKVYKEHVAANPDAANLGEKRPTARASKSNGEATEKRVKKEIGDDVMTDEEMRTMLEKGQLNKLTVAVLKAFAVSKKIAVTGLKKADLIERIEAWFERK